MCEEFLYVIRQEAPKLHLAVHFFPSGLDGIYQMEFGVLNEADGEVNTDVRTKCGDAQRLLAAITDILYGFLKSKRCGTMVRFSGDRLRMRLFSIWITDNWKYVQKSFVFYGFDCYGKWTSYVKNGRYGAVLVKIVNTSSDGHEARNI